MAIQCERKSPYWNMSDDKIPPEGRASRDPPILPRKQPIVIDISSEELRALQECNTESFWYRCVPISAVLITVTQLLTNRGVLTPHPRYGALFKNMGAALVGYFVGKVSYHETCRQKIMSLPNSRLGEAMRQGKRGRELFDEMKQPPDIRYIDTERDVRTTPPITDERRDTDIDSDVNKYRAGLDDSLRPTIDSLENELKKQNEPPPPDPAPSKPFVDYSELRKRNREQHEMAVLKQKEKVELNKKQVIKDMGEAETRQGPPASNQSRHRTNTYGDIIDD